MIFTSLSFLVFFLTVLSLLSVIQNQKMRTYVLLVASYVFYGWWSPVFVLLILVTSLWAWGFGLLIDRTNDEGRKSRYLFVSVAFSLGVLAYYKYAEFLAEAIFAMLGWEWSHDLGIILPVGISFFTFQTLSYSIDLRNGKIPVCESPTKFMLFVAFFPQLVAGPIVRASDFLPQLEKRIQISTRNIVIGAQLFLGGALQKTLIADNMSTFADPVFAEPALYSAATLWLGLAAYSIQIFCDFCGYSLMAIGIAKMLGFDLPENFRMPYLSRSITEFWRRWHISLSSWLRDYLYIALGGNRKGKARMYSHLMITMLLGGLWHGASWNFVLWGALHGIALAVHKIWEERTTAFEDLKATPVYSTFAWLTTLAFAALLWIPFRCVDFDTMQLYVSRMFSGAEGIAWVNPQVLMLLAIVVVWHLVYQFKPALIARFPSEQPERFGVQFALGISLFSIILFAPLQTSPFVYFQF